MIFTQHNNYLQSNREGFAPTQHLYFNKNGIIHKSEPKIVGQTQATHKML